ncbi:MAG TPA: hypothetical protein VL944_00085 [Candidatus Acidoferrum sp.]|nr:hypothetical protein [Candidatus Acidoferrum sp.]
MENDNEAYMHLFKALLDELSSASTDVVLAGGKKLLDDRSVAENLAARKIQPYLYLSGFLNLLGREISVKNISKIMKSIGMKPDRKLIDSIINADNENGVVYIYSVYLLTALGLECSIKNVTGIVHSLGVKPNALFVQNALDLYNMKYGKKINP